MQVGGKGYASWWNQVVRSPHHSPVCSDLLPARSSFLHIGFISHGPSRFPFLTDGVSRRQKASSGHLGKLRKDYVDYSTPGIYTLVGNIGKWSVMLSWESRCGSFLDLIFHLKKCDCHSPGFFPWFCSFVCSLVFLKLVSSGPVCLSPPKKPSSLGASVAHGCALGRCPL